MFVIVAGAVHVMTTGVASQTAVAHLLVLHDGRAAAVVAVGDIEPCRLGVARSGVLFRRTGVEDERRLGRRAGSALTYSVAGLRRGKRSAVEPTIRRLGTWSRRPLGTRFPRKRRLTEQRLPTNTSSFLREVRHGDGYDAPVGP